MKNTKTNNVISEFTPNENVYQAIIESLPHIVWVADSQGEIIFINQAWKTLIGYEPEEGLGVKWAESIHPDDTPGLMVKWQEAYENNKDYNGECRFVTKEGAMVHCSFIGMPIRNKEGKTVNWVGINLDITAQKKVEAELMCKIKELEDINNLMIDRELKMIELKNENKKLRAQLNVNDSLK